jgi:hypothetical protein
LLPVLFGEQSVLRGELKGTKAQILQD